MRSSKNQVTRKTIHHLRKRADHLAERITFATDRSPDAQIRKDGGRMSEVLDEWLDTIETMYESADDDLDDKAKSFALRLELAHEKVTSWGVPQKLPKPKRSKKKTSRRGRKKTNGQAA